MFGLSSQQSFILGVAALWVFSAAVGALPVPSGKNAFYTWFYTFAKTISGDLGTVFGKYLPQVPKVSALVVLGVLLPLMGCLHNANTTLPKGALNTFDADSYQALIATQASLNSFKSDASLVAIPEAKTALNQAIQDYDVALNAWKVYHSGGGSSLAVTTALTTLTADVLKIQGIIPGGKK